VNEEVAMSGTWKLAAKPVRFVFRPLYRALLRRLAAQLEASLVPVRQEVAAMSDRLQATLDAMDEALRTDRELIRDQDALFNSFLRDLSRLQVGVEELAWRLDRREPIGADGAVDAPPGRKRGDGVL
jgi:hypothetical protein